MPVEDFAVFVAEVPIPLDFFPKLCRAFTDFVFDGVVLGEVLARGEDAFDEEGCFNDVAAVVSGVEEGDGFAGAAVEAVSPCAVVARCFVLEEADDFEGALGGLFTGNEVAFCADDEVEESEAGAAGDADVASVGFVCSAGAGEAANGVGEVPEEAEGCFLDGGEQFFVGHGEGFGGDDGGGGAFDAVFFKDGDFVEEVFVVLADEVAVDVVLMRFFVDFGEGAVFRF